MKYRVFLGLASGMTALATMAPGTPSLAAPTEQPSRVRSAPAIPENYLDQKPSWTACFTEENLTDLPEKLKAAAKRLECAKVTAPRDWYNPNSGHDIHIAISRLTPETGVPTQSLFLNPGGPGGPGLTMPLLLADRPHVLGAMDAIGFDPRGTGESTNISCDGAPSDSSDPRNRDPRNLSLIADTSALIGRYCAFKSGDLLPYITTEQTVRDLDLVRHLLGRPTINWLGYSGGTWMGAYYATFFPKRVGKFVLDSNTDFTASWQKSFSHQPQGFERRFRQDFASWVALYDERFHLGTTAEKVRQRYEKLREDLNSNPIRIFGLSFDGPFLDILIAQSMYSKTEFQSVAETLSEFQQWVDNPSHIPVKVSDLSASLRRAVGHTRFGTPRGMRVLAGSADAATFYAITCNDTLWNTDPKYWNHESMAQGVKYPLLGWSMVSTQCAHWTRPSIQLPTPNGRGVPPVLMVQSKHDPATPYEGAIAAHKRFAGSRMLTVEGEGDHGIYSGDNTCANTVVEEFLVGGELPDRDLTCQGTGIAPPNDKPDSGETPAVETPNPLMRIMGYNTLLRNHVRF